MHLDKTTLIIRFTTVNNFLKTKPSLLFNLCILYIIGSHQEIFLGTTISDYDVSNLCTAVRGRRSKQRIQGQNNDWCIFLVDTLEFKLAH